MVTSIVMLGSGGFIGSHLLDRLLASPDVTIVGWDPDLSRIAHHLDDPRLEHHATTFGDPSTRGRLGEAVERADVVINLAAICCPSRYNTQPLEVIRSNFTDLWPLVDICAERGTWLVHFSTSEVYGRTLASYVGHEQSDARLYELDEDVTPLVMGPIHNQRWTYASAKQLLERVIYAHSAEHGLPYTIVRPLNFFGPGMDFIPDEDGEGVPRVLACFMAALLHNQPLKLVDGGRARRTIVCIEEAIDALMAILARPECSQGQIFNIGNPDNEVTIAELADLMRRAYAKVTGRGRFLRHPIVEVSSTEFYGPGYEDCDRRMPRVDKAEQLLGWRAQVPLEDLLLRAVADYHERYSSAAAVA